MFHRELSSGRKGDCSSFHDFADHPDLKKLKTLFALYFLNKYIFNDYELPPTRLYSGENKPRHSKNRVAIPSLPIIEIRKRIMQV